MSKPIYMPKYGMSMQEGKIVTWFVNEGDHIESGDEIAEISENKAVHTLTAKVSGTIEKIIVNEDEVAKAGEEIALVAED